MSYLSVPIDLEPVAALRRAAAHLDDVWFLDSAIGDAERGRRSRLVLESRVVVEGHEDRFVVYSKQGRPATLDASQSGWRALDRAFTTLRRRGEGLGWVGWCAYEMGALADDGIPAHAWDLPFAPLRFVEAHVVLEWSNGEARLLGAPGHEAALRHWEERLKKVAQVRVPSPAHLTLIEPPPRERHRRDVHAIVEAIRSGRIYQACYTFPLWFERPESTVEAYLALREASPGDYSAWIRSDSMELLSTSPERFLEVSGNVVRARPMKGTRPRSRGSEDLTIVELSNNDKDRAENVMIVDLLRNDLGRVCEIGSVHVPELFTVETYETVHQMTSTVEGRLAPDVGPFRLLRATFPPGSMTGAPKVEACRLLRELEPQARGLYAGTLGWLGYDDQWSFNVVIRTLQAYGHLARWDVGGGIVADSTPESEWEEALTKARPLASLGVELG